MAISAHAMARSAAAGCTPRCVVAAAAPARHRRVVARAAAPDLNDPEVRARLEQMQEAMKRPEVQAEMARMQAAMQNASLQKRMAELKDVSCSLSLPRTRAPRGDDSARFPARALDGDPRGSNSMPIRCSQPLLRHGILRCQSANDARNFRRRRSPPPAVI